MAAPQKSLAALFIGNSYTNRNDLPRVLERLALEGKPPIRLTTERVIANGMSLKTHWDRGIAAKTIGSGHWNFVVLQDQSTMGIKNPGRLKEYAAKFAGECAARHAKVVLYQTWAKQDAPQLQSKITAAYDDAAREIEAIVVPVGRAWQRAREMCPGINLYVRDESHPSPEGTYLSACVFYLTLLGQSPVGLPAVNISAEDAIHLQAVALALGDTK